MTRPRVAVSWSTGKDAAQALRELRRAGRVDVVGRFTSIVPAFGRVSMKGVRTELARAQEAAGPVSVEVGVVATREGFVYADLVAGAAVAASG
jgi:hypothetical protein